MERITEAVKHIIIINVILFAAGPLMGLNFAGMACALFSEKSSTSASGNFVSHMFMHGGFAHILFNMYALWAFGTPLEQMWGRNKFLFFYFSAGIGAGLDLILQLITYQFNSTYQDLIQLGMNAGKYSANFKYRSSITPRSLRPYPKKKYRNFFRSTILLLWEPRGQYWVLVAFECHTQRQTGPDLFSGAHCGKILHSGSDCHRPVFRCHGISLFGGGIAHFAHVGGAVIGFIIMQYWKKHQFNRWN